MPDLTRYELFREVFGINVKDYNGGDFKEIGGFQEAVRQSELGTPIIFPTTFQEGEYKIYDDYGEIKTVSLDEYHLPSSTTIDCRRAKVVRETIIPGNSGAVTELYGFTPWTITMRGFFLDAETSAYEQHKKLLNWEKLADKIPVISEILQAKFIFSLSIREINFTQLAGKPGVLPFEISARSETERGTFYTSKL